MQDQAQDQHNDFFLQDYRPNESSTLQNILINKTLKYKKKCNVSGSIYQLILMSLKFSR